MGGEDGSGEAVRDTIAPLTRDQHSKVQAAARAAKAAAKTEAPKKPKPKVKKPLTQDERMAAIRRLFTKAKAKDRFDVPTVNPDDMDHDDLRDLHQSLHVSRAYNEEVEQIDELDQKTLKSYIDKSIKTGRADDAEGAHNLYKATSKVARNLSTSTLKNKVSKLKYTSMAKHKNPFEYQVSRDELANRKVSEEIELDEVTKQEAEKALGGPVKTRTGSEPKGKLPLGFRRARNLARKAMKTVKESTTEVLEVNEMNHGKKLAKMIMAKQSQHPIAQNMGEENIVEQDDMMEKKEMAQTQLHFIKYAAEEILEFIDMGGEIEEWYQNKLSKVQSEVESLHSYIEGEKRRTGMVKEEEQIDEKAPPGAKFERMVKHIKKGYAKGGLTPKEKSIAYATAWKAYGKKEEVEQVNEMYGGEVNGKRFDYEADEHELENDKKLHRVIASQNDHLDHDEVKAIVHSGGYSRNVKVGKNTHRVEHDDNEFNEEVEQIYELSKGLLMRAASKAGRDAENTNNPLVLQVRDKQRDKFKRAADMKDLSPVQQRKLKMQGEEVEQIDEKLIGNQHKIDADKSGHINARDFKLLRMKDRLKSAAAKKMGK